MTLFQDAFRRASEEARVAAFQKALNILYRAGIRGNVSFNILEGERSEIRHEGDFADARRLAEEDEPAPARSC